MWLSYIAVSDSPDGPWERLASNPALKNSDNPDVFDSHLVDDACLIAREGKYWFYYKGRQLGKSPAQTQMGLAIAEHPQGPYLKHESNAVIPGNHEVLVWPQGTGVAAMIGRVVGYETDNRITSAGSNVWKPETGLFSIWVLGMYNPSPETTVVIPFNEGEELTLGPKVNDAYFGKVPPEYLKVEKQRLFFRGDGTRRGKIGITPQRSGM